MTWYFCRSVPFSRIYPSFFFVQWQNTELYISTFWLITILHWISNQLPAFDESSFSSFRTEWSSSFLWVCRQILELELVPLCFEYVCLVMVNADISHRFFFFFSCFLWSSGAPCCHTFFSRWRQLSSHLCWWDTVVVCPRAASGLKIDTTVSQSNSTNLRK